MKLADKKSSYLQSSYYIDCNSANIISTAERLTANSEIETAENIFHFVRDSILYSWDIQDKRAPARASEVLETGVSICYGKANLLAAIMRAAKIPSGICYQRLTLGDTPATGFCVHALNAVFLNTIKKWIRLDPRGNTAFIHSAFDTEEEKLAFKVRPEIGEIDYPEIYSNPLPITMSTLEKNSDALFMYQFCLPDRI
jgi:transglutaminase-like putative cysteine protease